VTFGGRIVEHDQHAFKELFDSEPIQASAPETAEWVDVYQRLVAIMERAAG